MLSKQFRHPLENAMVQVRNMGHLNWSRNFKSYKISSVDWISPVVWRHWFQLGVSPTILPLNSVNEQPTVSVSVSLYFVAHYNVFFPLLHLLFRGACFSVACYCFFPCFPLSFLRRSLHARAHLSCLLKPWHWDAERVTVPHFRS